MRTLSEAHTILHVDGFEVHVGHGLFTESGGRVKLQPQPLRVLEHLLLRAPALVSRDELRETVWPEVHVDFDQSLNFCIRQIRAVLNDSATKPRYIETLPKQGYRFIGTISTSSGRPSPANMANITEEIAAAAAAVELLISAAPALPRLGMRAARSGSRRSFVLATGVVLLLLAVITALLIEQQAHVGQQSTGSIHSLAVLPLENFSGDPAQDYLADGLTDELTTMLAKNSSLRVISRTSVMRFRDVREPLPQIARKLGADAILEGSLARNGGTVHIALQLIQASTDGHLWAESYDRNPGDSAALPREVALAIAQRTHSSVAVTLAPRFVSPAAHDAYLRGRYLWFSGLNQEAGEAFRHAVQLQPDYALGWAGLASYYGAGTIFEQHELDPREALPLAEQAARRAVEFDDSLADAHLSLGAALYFGEWNWPAALQEIDRAIELDPHAYQALHFRAKILASLSRHDEAIQIERTASERDPFARPWAVGSMLLLARRYDSALKELLEKAQAEPANVNILQALMDTYACMGRHQQFAQTFATWLELTGRPVAGSQVRTAFARGGHIAVLEWELGDLRARSASGYVSPVDFADIEAALGHREEALTHLEAGLEQHSPLLLWLQDNPVYDSLHSDPRYRSVIARIGLPPAY